MVAYLSQLHQDVDDGQEVAGLQCVFGVGARHEVVIEEPLPFGQRAPQNVLELLRELLLYLAFEPPKEEGPEDLVKPFDEPVIVFSRPFHHPSQRV